MTGLEVFTPSGEPSSFLFPFYHLSFCPQHYNLTLDLVVMQKLQVGGRGGSESTPIPAGAEQMHKMTNNKWKN